MRRYRVGEMVNTKFGRGMITCWMGSEFVIVSLERGAYHTTEAELDLLNNLSEDELDLHDEPAEPRKSETSQRRVVMTGRVNRAGNIEPIKISDYMTIIPAEAVEAFEKEEAERQAAYERETDEIQPETTAERMKRESNERLFEKHKARRETVIQ